MMLILFKQVKFLGFSFWVRKFFLVCYNTILCSKISQPFDIFIDCYNIHLFKFCFQDKKNSSLKTNARSLNTQVIMCKTKNQ